MKCHYEILGVDRDAEVDVIKKSYRKLALKWHPDKNPDNPEECSQQMILIQQAWDVLSDRQERTWYDRHREAILRGGVDGEYQDDSLDVFAYFTTTCYSGYRDDETGFYSVYRDVFDKIAQEDAEYIKNDGTTEPLDDFPSFGRSDSSYDDVVGPFYGFWSGYSTYRSFAWLDEHDIRQAPNRMVLRAMEKENKKLREAGRKERNDNVRALVAFVRKRDKRIKAYREELERKRVKAKQKAEDHRIAQIKQSIQKANEYKAEISEEAKQAHENSLQEIENEWLSTDDEIDDGDCSDVDRESLVVGDLDGNEQQQQQQQQEGQNQIDLAYADDELDSLYCIACEKAFKTDKAMANHNKSKKHREAVAKLKAILKEEDQYLLGDDNAFEDPDADAEAMLTTQPSSGKKSKRQKKKKKALQVDLYNDEDNDGTTNGDETVQGASFSEQFKSNLDLNADNGNGESEEFTIVTSDPNDSTIIKNSSVDPNPSTSLSSQVTNNSKQQQQPAGSAVEPPSSTAPTAEPKSALCDACKEEFPSRSKLFAHLKESGHATLKTPAAPAANFNKNTKKGKNKRLKK